MDSQQYSVLTIHVCEALLEAMEYRRVPVGDSQKHVSANEEPELLPLVCGGKFLFVADAQVKLPNFLPPRSFPGSTALSQT